MIDHHTFFKGPEGQNDAFYLRCIANMGTAIHEIMQHQEQNASSANGRSSTRKKWFEEKTRSISYLKVWNETSLSKLN